MAPLGGLGRSPQKSCVKTFEKTPNMQTVNPGIVSGLSSLVSKLVLAAPPKCVSYFLGTISASLKQIASNQTSHCLYCQHQHQNKGCHFHDHDHHHHHDDIESECGEQNHLTSATTVGSKIPALVVQRFLLLSSSSLSLQ